VCVYAPLNVTRCKNNHLHLQCVGRRGHSKEEIKKERKKADFYFTVFSKDFSDGIRECQKNVKKNCRNSPKYRTVALLLNEKPDGPV